MVHHHWISMVHSDSGARLNWYVIIYSDGYSTMNNDLQWLIFGYLSVYSGLMMVNATCFLHLTDHSSWFTLKDSAREPG